MRLGCIRSLLPKSSARQPTSALPTASDVGGHVTAYTYDAAGRLITVAGAKGNTAYGYDDAGNLVTTTITQWLAVHLYL